MKQLMIIATTLSTLIQWTASQCIYGLTVSNQTNAVLTGCNELIDNRALFESPYISYSKAAMNDTYIIMLLETIAPNQVDMFRLKWLVAGVKFDPRSGLLQTKIGVNDLAGGYSPPMNHTVHLFRLYKMTGKHIWDQVNANEKNFFVPTQWLGRNNIPLTPLAQMVFTVKPFVPGMTAGLAPGTSGGFMPMPVDGNPPYPTQYLPNYPSSQPQQPPQVYPPSRQPPLTYPGQHPPPSYPNPSQPQLRPIQNNFNINNDVHLTPNQYIINGTVFRRFTHEMIRHNILEINSTKYSSDFTMKRYTLSPYLIIDNKSYTWRNQTHVPGIGASVYINGTQYVPYNPPANEIHHYHYKKGSASSAAPTILLFTFFIPLIHSFSQT